MRRTVATLRARGRWERWSEVQLVDRLLDWYDLWSLDLARLGSDARKQVVTGLLAFPGGDAFWDKVFEVWCLVFVVSALNALGWTRVEGPIALHAATGSIYVYESPAGHRVTVMFQRKGPLPVGRWSYRDGGPLRGVPDLILTSDVPGSPPLLIDAKNRYVASGRLTRSEETYKMLGYAENFRPETTPAQFRGLLIFPSDSSAGRIIDGPEEGRLDLVTVDLLGGRAAGRDAVCDAITTWSALLG